MSFLMIGNWQFTRLRFSHQTHSCPTITFADSYDIGTLLSLLIAVANRFNIAQFRFLKTQKQVLRICCLNSCFLLIKGLFRAHKLIWGETNCSCFQIICCLVKFRGWVLLVFLIVEGLRRNHRMIKVSMHGLNWQDKGTSS